MKKKIVLPKLSKNMKYGVIVHWCKKPGDTFNAGDPLVEIEADKVICELEAPKDGMVDTVLHEIGSTVAVGEDIMVVQLR